MSRQRLRQSFIEWRTELSQHSSALKSIYFIKEKLNNKKCKSIDVNINPFMKKYIIDNFQTEISKIEDETKCAISFIDDIAIDNSEIHFEEENKVIKKTQKKTGKKIVKKRSSVTKKKPSAIKKTKEKEKIIEDQILSPIKVIKDKKSGWWQK